MASTPTTRSWGHPGNEFVQELCEANGIAEENFLHSPESISEIEMFMFNCPVMKGFHLFPKLTSITINLQNLTEITSLDNAIHLQSLWVVDCKLTQISGLDSCSGLTKLCLYSNHIEKIENLDHLTQLEEIHLMDNRISRLDGLSTLVSLRRLYVARNRVETIGSSLANNMNLTELNISDNKLGCFKDVLNLARLPLLTCVCYLDALYGSNPLCRLCNYQTYMLFHLQQLTSLDTLPVSEDSKQLAEATYMKKKMYYNMRIKTLKRNTTAIIRRTKDLTGARLTGISGKLDRLCRLHCDITRDIHLHTSQSASAQEEETPVNEFEAALNSPPSQKDEKLDQLRRRLAAVQANLEEKQKLLLNVANDFEDVKHKLVDISELNISRFIVELETGGNIRLEDGKPSDVWYTSCVDLVNSRFFLPDFAEHQVAELRVVRVTRVHNRFLRNRFEAKLESVVDTSDVSYKRSLEYLFHGEDPRLPGEILRVAEYGFRDASEYQEMGMDGGVPLSNSLSTCDALRLSTLAKNRDRAVPTGQLLITKVYLAKTVAENTGLERVTKSAYQPCDAVYRVKASDARQRTWFVFDRDLVLPEYLVEFEYVFSSKAHHEPPAEFVAELAGQGLLPASDADLVDVAPLARTVVKFVYDCQLLSLRHQEDPTFDAIVAEAPSEDSQPSKVFLISEDVLAQACVGNAKLSQLRYLNLHGNSIRKIEGLSGLSGLRVLILSFNELHKMEGMQELHNLERLELGYNQIRRIECVKGFKCLLALQLNNNHISRAEDLSVLRKYTPSLTELDLHNNPVCETKCYRQLVLRRLRKLERFEGHVLSPVELNEAQDSNLAVTLPLIRDNAYGHHRTPVTRMMPLLDGAEEADWPTRVEELELSRHNLRKMANFDALPNLRRLNLCENEVSRIEGLEQCKRLEELLLEDNRLLRIENMQGLCNLKKLDLGRNRITELTGLEMLCHLTQLSVEDNELERIGPALRQLTALMELYLGNNRISSLKEVLEVRDLPKLIILDLSNNPMSRQADYRLYIVFHLRKLKVLDGVSVESSEVHSARDAFSGKLTEEFLVEKIGHHFFEHIRELDLSNNKVRMLGSVMNGDDFCNLRVLNLDNNNIVDITDIALLPALTVLRLNSNRIQDIGPTVVAQDGSETPTTPVPVGGPLCTLLSLEVLQLGNNELSSVANAGLALLPELKVLFLQGNDLSKIEGLSGMTQLRELVLDKNRIRALEDGCFDYMINLRELRLEENGLKSLNHLPPLPRLHTLYLGINRLSDMVDVERLSILPQLQEVTMVNNPVARKQLYRGTAIYHAQNLRILDYKEVTMDERDRVESMFQLDQRAGASTSYAVGGGVVYNGIDRSGGSGSSSKVPMKMTAVTFDACSGLFQGNSPGGTASSIAPTPPSNVSSASSGASATAVALGQNPDWHPYTNSTGDFFLPSGKLSGRSRPDEEMSVGSNNSGKGAKIERTVSAERSRDKKIPNEVMKRMNLMEKGKAIVSTTTGTKTSGPTFGTNRALLKPGGARSPKHFPSSGTR